MRRPGNHSAARTERAEQTTTIGLLPGLLSPGRGQILGKGASLSGG